MSASTIKDLTVFELSAYLKDKGVPDDVCEKFEDEEIDGQAFLELSDTEIKTISTKIGVIKKISRLIKENTNLSQSGGSSFGEKSPPPQPSGMLSPLPETSPGSTFSLDSPVSPTLDSDAASTSSSILSSASAALSKRTKDFNIPSTWRPSIMQALEAESDTEKRKMLSRETRSEIVRDLVSQMYAYMESPTKAFCTEVAKKFIQKYPFAKDVGINVTGYGSWERKIIDRVHNTRSKERKRPSPGDCLPPTKRGRPKLDTVLSRYPPLLEDPQDEVTEERNAKVLASEMERENPRKEVVLSLVKLTFASRRQYVLESHEISVSTITEKFKFFRLPYVLEQELDLIMKKKELIRIAISQWREKWVPAIKDHAEKNPSKVVRDALVAARDSDDLSEDGDEKLAFKLLCAMLLKKGCLPFVYEECKITDDVDTICKRDPPRPAPRFGNFGEQYFVIVEREVICSVTAFSKALMIWFAVHYIFNLEYCLKTKDLCMFMQEFLFNSAVKLKKTSTYLSVTTSLQTYFD